MACNEPLAERIRVALEGQPALTEKKMFGGLSFLAHRNIGCGVVRNDLVGRVGPEHHQEALARPLAREMDFTGKPLKGFVYVGPQGYGSDPSPRAWIGLALQFAETLPPK